ncbi:zinc dependent phospholipase C family protein [uncultured Pseudodesulfovibrio sp.]|uniref:zinc dependent phospholipase C family protein n=1 Tax=uncultured Pseudodesulfovibrio sp. TaxID=2035858 RepID=UPI0029C95933|nr:zinc dependent phospholipase C family protein [uncultured Pseudodesulfovibrio sp.]
MPGAYAHLTMVNRFKTPRALEAVQGLAPDKAYQVTRWTRFVELGAVSPDYPYLSVMDSNSKIWADAMHYTNVGDRLKAGIEVLRDLAPPVQDKAFVWLLGFASHIAMDLTIHPIVEMKVGEYAENAEEHRTCEMHQDVFIFEEMNFGPLAFAEFIDAGIGRCNDQGDDERIDSDIKHIWMEMLERTSSVAVLEETPPDMDKWHRRFRTMVDDIAEETQRLPAIARHALADMGAAYPIREEVDDTFVINMKVPGGGRMNYTEIFDKAQKSVAYLWSLVARGVFENDNEYKTAIHNWNLDNGKRPDGTLEFWR